MIFGWLGWSLRSTTCSSASSAYRPSSVVASRSSMPRRSASASNDWLVLAISLVLIWCLLVGAGFELRARRFPGTVNGPSKPRPEHIGQLRDCRDLGIPHYNDASHAGDPWDRRARGTAGRDEGSAPGQ